MFKKLIKTTCNTTLTIRNRTAVRAEKVGGCDLYEKNYVYQIVGYQRLQDCIYDK